MAVGALLAAPVAGRMEADACVVHQDVEPVGSPATRSASSAWPAGWTGPPGTGRAPRRGWRRGPRPGPARPAPGRGRGAGRSRPPRRRLGRALVRARRWSPSRVPSGPSGWSWARPVVGGRRRPAPSWGPNPDATTDRRRGGDGRADPRRHPAIKATIVAGERGRRRVPVVEPGTRPRHARAVARRGPATRARPTPRGARGLPGPPRRTHPSGRRGAAHPQDPGGRARKLGRHDVLP